MTHKEIEKQNFILWYRLYATEKELEVAQKNSRDILDRLLKEYAEEIDKIDRSRHFYERIVQQRSVQTQGIDATLQIDCFSTISNKNDILEKV